MFVRIIRGIHDSLYECSQVRVFEDDNCQLNLTMENLKLHEIEVVVDKNVPEALGVYYMNDAGKTIEVLFQKHSDEEVATPSPRF